MDENSSIRMSDRVSDAELKANEDAISVLLQDLRATWGDADAYAALFTEDADYVAFDGSRARGRNEIVAAHRPLFETVLKGSRLVKADLPTDVRFLAPDVALIHDGGGVLRARQKKLSRRSISIQTLVAVKREDRWLFTAFQNTRYRPFPQTLLGKLLVPRTARAAQPTGK